MSRLMSVALTEQAVVERRKTVTRRLGWQFLKAGDRLTLVRKVQGRKPGEPIVRLAEVEVVSVRREPLLSITKEEREAEGVDAHEYTDTHSRWCAECANLMWAEWFAREMGCALGSDVTRIEWRYVG